MAGYCTRADVVALLPSGGLPNPARVAAASASANYIELDQHNLEDDDTVTFRADGGSVPGGLTAGTIYYVKVVDTSRFQVAASPGGLAIDLTTDGSNFVAWAELPWNRWIDAGARDIDPFLPVHVTPLVLDEHGKYPQVVVTANAELAGLRGLMATGGATIDYGTKLDPIRTRLTQWAKTLPVRGVSKSTQSPANLAITADASAGATRGWAAGGRDVIP